MRKIVTLLLPAMLALAVQNTANAQRRYGSRGHHIHGLSTVHHAGHHRVNVGRHHARHRVFHRRHSLRFASRHVGHYHGRRRYGYSRPSYRYRYCR